MSQARRRPDLVDLSHRIVSGRAGYPGLPAPRIEPYISHEASSAAYGGLAEFEITRLFLVGNTGTYLDSPAHRFPGRPDIAALPLAAVAGLRGVCLDAVIGEDGRRIADLATTDDAPVVPGTLHGAAVLVRTGWAGRHGSAAYWRPGPFLSDDVVGRLIDERAALVGVDCWNVDDPDDLARPAHTRLLGAGIPIIEHLTGLDQLPSRGFRFHAAPLAIEGAASLPVRAYAEIDQAGWTPADRKVRR